MKWGLDSLNDLQVVLLCSVALRTASNDLHREYIISVIPSESVLCVVATDLVVGMQMKVELWTGSKWLRKGNPVLGKRSDGTFIVSWGCPIPTISTVCLLSELSGFRNYTQIFKDD